MNKMHAGVRRFVLGLLIVSLTRPIMASGAESQPNLVAMGHALFEDKSLSVDRSVSCASCHQANHAFSDPRPVSIGVAGKRGTRHAPSLLETGEYSSFFWDGRANTLEEQVRMTILSPVECGFSSPGQLIARISQNPVYVNAFQVLNGTPHRPVTLSDITRAIVAYIRTLGPPPNALDGYLAGDHSAMPVAAQRGLAVFEGKADCAGCHVIAGREAPLTDNQFHSSGVGLSAISPVLAQLAIYAAQLSQQERYQTIASDSKMAALGRYLVTLDPKDIGLFRTPSLRNVALTGPYMHDGSIKTLAQAVDIELYYRGLALGHPILLSSAEKQDLLVFLQNLSSLPQRTVAAINPGVSRPTLSEHTGAHARRGP